MMEEGFINIKCPMCGCPLKLKNFPGIESKSIKCSICNQTNKFADFETITSFRDEVTTYTKKTENTIGIWKDSSDLLGRNPLPPIGHLEVLGTNQQFQLKIGRNVIGRKASVSTADFQISPSSGDRKMSREHIVINVTDVPGQGIVHSVSLYKKLVNETFVNGVILDFGCEVILTDRDIIQLPGIELRFLLPDPEQTQLYSY